jgi:hypothetical protein
VVDDKKQWRDVRVGPNVQYFNIYEILPAEPQALGLHVFVQEAGQAIGVSPHRTLKLRERER